jgi:superoxide reductase
MTQKNQIYKCNVCGNMVEMVHNGAGQLVCCGKPMQLMDPNTVDAAKEKHVPVVTREPGKVKVQVGALLHPMEDKHFIEWIEIIADNRSYRKFLHPSQKPEVEFHTQVEGALEVRAYCNLHGLWKA